MTNVSRGANAVQRRSPRWPWFLAGFLIVFISTSLLITMYLIRSDGAAIQSVKLWEFYLIEIPRALSFKSTTMGPGGSSTSNLVVVAAFHLAWSAAGGLAAIAVRCVVMKVRGVGN